MGHIELIARAVIQREDKILLAHKIGDPNTFLPGGHIDYGEYSDAALIRELREELGIEAEIGEFMGLQEYQFKDWDGRHHHEINFIYRAETKDEIKSRESHLEFLWCEFDQLEEKMLLPDTLPSLITDYMMTGKTFHSTR